MRRSPVFHIPGNHDIPKYGAEALAQYLDEFGYDRFSFSYNGSAFIGLNSNAMVCDSERAAADAAPSWSGSGSSWSAIASAITSSSSRITRSF